MSALDVTGLQISGLRDPDEIMDAFSKEVMGDRAKERAFINTNAPAKGGVESSTVVVPMTAGGFEAPKGRDPRQVGPPLIKHKPFSFALEYDTSGALCYFGSLVALVTRAESTASGPSGNYVTQDEIAESETLPATNLNVVDNWSYMPTKLNAFGDVYLKWECDGDTGEVDAGSVEVLVAESPESIPIPSFVTDDPPTGITAVYYKKIGTVSETGEVTQNLAGDHYWSIHLLRGGSTEG